MTRAERRRHTREGRSLVGELRRNMDLDSVTAPGKDDWLNAVDMAGYHYEYLSNDAEKPIYGVYGKGGNADLRVALYCIGDDVQPFIPA